MRYQKNELVGNWKWHNGQSIKIWWEKIPRPKLLHLQQQILFDKSILHKLKLIQKPSKAIFLSSLVLKMTEMEDQNTNKKNYLMKKHNGQKTLKTQAYLILIFGILHIVCSLYLLLSIFTLCRLSKNLLKYFTSHNL